MDELKLGWASRHVTTDKPINIPGQFHMRISQGIMDPLTVSTLVVDNGADLVIFLSADLVVIRSGLLDDVRAKVTELNPDIPVDKILMNATHTHTGASHYSDASWRRTNTMSTPLPGEVPHDGVEIASGDEYRDFLATQAAEAICEAYATRAPGGIALLFAHIFCGSKKRGADASRVTSPR